MSRSHRISIGVAMLLAWSVLFAVSMAANYMFAHSLARSPLEGTLLGAGALASDIFKAAMPAAVLLFLAKRWYWTSFVGLLVGVITFGFSLTAAVGFVSSERLSHFDKANSQAKLAALKAKDIAYLETQSQFVPEHRPLAIVNADLAGLTAQREWRWSDGCTTVKGAQTAAFCEKVAKLRVEAAAAETAAKVRKEVRAVGTELAGMDNTSGDYQVNTIAKLVGQSPSLVVVLLVALTVLLVEAGAGLGLTLALAMLTPDGTPLGNALRAVAKASNANEPPPPAKPAQPVATAPPAAPTPVERLAAAGPPEPRPGPPRQGYRGTAATFPSGGSGVAADPPPTVVRKFRLRPPQPAPRLLHTA